MGTPTASHYTYFDWPAQVLIAMVYAKLYWSVNADAAIEFYLEYKDLKGMWDGYACNAILAALQRDWAPPCELFERFVTHVTRHHDSASGHQNSFKSRAVRAQLMLFHPEKPDPALYLDWIRSPGAVERMKQWKKDAKSGPVPHTHYEPLICFVYREPAKMLGLLRTFSLTWMRMYGMRD
ncbi:hypothetical protein Slin15195_G038730 [Septoria linicola]|uniref:Uncharacterized protein n=1 Tax=Septoria linicola TaxID=215465 RepID=A0A9Q9AJM4_9PEZI|nr:hypothetical protein Slin15195_G038730 [Septoria linicola]